MKTKDIKFKIINRKYKFYRVASIGELIDAKKRSGNINKYCGEGAFKIPKDKGVYLVVVNNKAAKFNKPPCDVKDTGNNRYLTDNLNKILKNSMKKSSSYKRVIYIGKAGGRKGLEQRIKQYIYSKSKKNPMYRGHRGGRAIWQINNLNNLDLYIHKTSNEEMSCEDLEAHLISESKDTLVNMRK